MAMHPFLLWLEQLLMSRKKSRVWKARSVNSVSALTRLWLICRMRAIFLNRRDAVPLQREERLTMPSWTSKAHKKSSMRFLVLRIAAQTLRSLSLPPRAGMRVRRCSRARVFCAPRLKNNKEPSRSSSVYAQRSPTRNLSCARQSN